jgi:hypothetical protein
MRWRPSPQLARTRGTQAAEYPRKNVCEENELLGLCRPGWPSGEAVERRCFGGVVAHAGKPRRGAVGDVQQDVGEVRFE